MRLHVRSALEEVRSILGAVRTEHEDGAEGSVVVSGMLAEQLARELAAGAQPGAVVTGGVTRLPGARAVVHVMAGEPSPADEALVRQADGLGVPVVLVQLWPQEHWTAPFVLTPFVVECRAGEGFPVATIASRTVEAIGHSTALARRVPVFRETIARAVVTSATIRSALIGALSSRRSRPLLTLEQVQMLRRLQALQDSPPAGGDGPRALAAPAAAAAATGFALRSLVRTTRGFVPARLANAAVAAAGTWALGTAFLRLGDRLSS